MSITYRPLVQTKGFRYSDPLTYSNGNLQDHAPWQYFFADCATLIGFMANNRFEETCDTVGGDGSAIGISTAPIGYDWIVQVQYNGQVNATLGRWCFGLVTFTAGPAISGAIGVSIRRVVNGGAVTLNDGRATGWGAGVCASSELILPDGNIVAGDVIKIVTQRVGATDDYTVDFFKNGVANGTRTLNGGAGNIGGRPAFWSSSAGGTQGIAAFNNFSCRQRTTIISPSAYRI
jgi:hypothetical protein